VHSDTPPWKQAGLPWCQHTCPVCQWAGHTLSWARVAYLPTFNAVVGLASRGGPSATGTWQGRPCGRLLGSLRWHVAASDPLPGGRGVPGPRGQTGWAGPEGSGTWRHRTPWGVQACGGHSRASCPHGHVEAPDLYEHGGGGGPETIIPAVRPGPYAPSPIGQGRGHG
jgi:hypothetical protein